MLEDEIIKKKKLETFAKAKKIAKKKNERIRIISYREKKFKGMKL
jgi:hypothetical protein